MRSVALILVLAACKGKEEPTETAPPDETLEPDTTTEPDTTLIDAPIVTDCGPLPLDPDAIIVAEGEDVEQAVNDAPAGATVALEEGEHDLSRTLALTKPITLRSVSGNPEDVRLNWERNGDAGILVGSSDVTVAHVSIKTTNDEGILVQARDNDVLNTLIYNVHVIDSGAWGIRVIPNDAKDTFSDDGEISCSHLELTPPGQAVIRTLCNTGGIQADRARNWVIADNRIEDFFCEENDAGPGIEIIRGSRDIVVERNVVGNSPRGIVAGESRDIVGRRYDDDPCGDITMQSIDVMVRNNMIYTQGTAFEAASSDFEVGILAETACNVSIVHNTIHSAREPLRSSIEHRYDTTTGTIANNLVSQGVVRVDESGADVAGNYENATLDFFYSPEDGDYHLAPNGTIAVAGQANLGFEALAGPDIDGQPREGNPEPGADETSSL